MTVDLESEGIAEADRIFALWKANAPGWLDEQRRVHAAYDRRIMAAADGGDPNWRQSVSVQIAGARAYHQRLAALHAFDDHRTVMAIERDLRLSNPARRPPRRSRREWHDMWRRVARQSHQREQA